MAGKTTIVKGLEGCAVEQTEQTNGIDISVVKTPTAAGTIFLHCWDFAGQVWSFFLLYVTLNKLYLELVHHHPSVLHWQQFSVSDCV